MIERQYESCLIRPGDVPASRDDFEVVGTFNPGAVATGRGDEVVLLVRVAERPREQRPGFTALPRWDVETGRVVVDWVANDEVDRSDPRKVEYKSNGLWRLTFMSHLRVLRSPDGRSVDSFEGPPFLAQSRYEEYGVEDARITRIDERFYITYVAASRHGPATALASTTDFETFERHGIIFCPENKDVVLFPQRFGSDYVALHRPAPLAPFNMPEMWLARSTDLCHWGRHEHFLSGGGGWDDGRIGGGTPPLRTDRGWLEIYHGQQRTAEHGVIGAYAAGAVLMDIENPARVIAQTPEPILTATAEYEANGFVPNVIFPTGVVQRGDTLLVYVGAADTATAVVELSLTDVLGSLR